MKTEDLGKSRLLNLLFKPAGLAMESKLRRLLHDPVKILHGADIQPGQSVLEVGSGTGFFTMVAARMIGDHGRFIAMEPLMTYVERLNEKVEAAGLRNVQVVRRDALNTGLDAARIDRALLFGVLPFPSLPLNCLLPEMHRILKSNGTLAVWMFPIAGYVPGSIRRSAWFAYLHRRNGVYNYRATTRRELTHGQRSIRMIGLRRLSSSIAANRDRSNVSFCVGFSDADHTPTGEFFLALASEKRQGRKSRGGAAM